MFVTKLDVLTYLCHKYDTVSTKYQTNVMYSCEESRRRCVVDLVVCGFTNTYCLIEPTLTKEVIRELYEKVKLYRLSGCPSSSGYKIIGCLPDSERTAREAKDLVDYLRTIDYGVVVEFLSIDVVKNYRQFNAERNYKRTKEEDYSTPANTELQEKPELKNLVAIGLIAAGLTWTIAFGTVSKIKSGLNQQPVTESANR